MVTSYYKIASAYEKKLRAIIVSDTHGREFGKILEAVRVASPDIILFPGDMFNASTENQDEYIKEISRGLSEISPVFYSIGNHDNNLTESQREIIKESGVILLDNSYVDYSGIKIGGLTTGFTAGSQQGHFKRTPEPDLNFLARFGELRGFRILLSHHPEFYGRYMKNSDINLIVSGHAHGGQIRLFGMGMFAPGQGIFPRYTKGVYDNRLVVSTGLVNSTFVPRLFNPIEIVVIDLIPKEENKNNQ